MDYLDFIVIFYGAFSLLMVLLGIALAGKGDTAQNPGVAAAKLMGAKASQHRRLLLPSIVKKVIFYVYVCPVRIEKKTSKFKPIRYA
jgi:hypothetical protein